MVANQLGPVSSNQVKPSAKPAAEVKEDNKPSPQQPSVNQPAATVVPTGDIQQNLCVRVNKDGTVTNIFEDGEVTPDEVVGFWSDNFFEIADEDHDGRVTKSELEAVKQMIKLYATTFNLSIEDAVKSYIQAEGFSRVNLTGISAAKGNMKDQFNTKKIELASQLAEFKKNADYAGLTDDQILFLETMKAFGYVGKKGLLRDKEGDLYLEMIEYRKNHPDAGWDELFEHLFSLFEASRQSTFTQKKEFGVARSIYRISTGQAGDVQGWFEGKNEASLYASNGSERSAVRALRRMQERFTQDHGDPYKLLQDGHFDDPDVEAYFVKMEQLVAGRPASEYLQGEMRSFLKMVLQEGVGKSGLENGKDFKRVDSALKWISIYENFAKDNAVCNDSDREIVPLMKAFVAMRIIDMGAQAGIHDKYEEPKQDDKTTNKTKTKEPHKTAQTKEEKAAEKTKKAEEKAKKAAEGKSLDPYLARAFALIASTDPKYNQYKAWVYAYAAKALADQGRTDEAKKIMGRDSVTFGSITIKMPEYQKSWTKAGEIAQPLGQYLPGGMYYSKNEGFGKEALKYFGGEVPKGGEGGGREGGVTKGSQNNETPDGSRGAPDPKNGGLPS